MFSKMERAQQVRHRVHRSPEGGRQVLPDQLLSSEWDFMAQIAQKKKLFFREDNILIPDFQEFPQNIIIQIIRACAIDFGVTVRCLLSGGNARTQKKISQKNSEKKIVQKNIEKPYKNGSISNSRFGFPQHCGIVSTVNSTSCAIKYAWEYLLQLRWWQT